MDNKLGASLLEAEKIINGERQNSYGNPEDSFALIAKYWQTYIEDKSTKLCEDEGCPYYGVPHICNPYELTALDVSHMMILFKLARCVGQAPSRDNYIDIQGYSAIAADRLIKEVVK